VTNTIEVDAKLKAAGAEAGLKQSFEVNLQGVLWELRYNGFQELAI
jgi:hypothetical protein